MNFDFSTKYVQTWAGLDADRLRMWALATLTSARNGMYNKREINLDFNVGFECGCFRCEERSSRAEVFRVASPLDKMLHGIEEVT